MKLRYNPYQIFTASKTPAGLYARQKWLGQTGSQKWKTDFEETVAKLSADQADDGSWGETEAEWDTFLAVHALRNKGLLQLLKLRLRWVRRRLQSWQQ